MSKTKIGDPQSIVHCINGVPAFSGMTPLGIGLLLGLALIWGVAEASIFFVVPDVIISYIALKYGLRSGLIAAALAVVGAMIGGAIVYFWGTYDIIAARSYFDALPAIAPATIERAQGEVGQPALILSMIKGSLTSVPYKLYASEAGAAGVSFWVLMALTPLARMPRFLFAALGFAAARKWLPRFITLRPLAAISLFWIVFYAIYWLNAPN